MSSLALGNRRASGLIAAMPLLFVACAGALQRPAQAPAAGALSELWEEPHDLASRNLYWGPGGRELAPARGTYSYVSRKTTGTNPGYDVRDARGMEWSVKLGEEAQSEV